MSACVRALALLGNAKRVKVVEEDANELRGKLLDVLCKQETLFPLGELKQLVLLSSNEAKNHGGLFPACIDFSKLVDAMEQFEIENPTHMCAVSTLALEAMTLKRHQMDKPWSEIARELSVDCDALFNALISAWRLGLRPELLQSVKDDEVINSNAQTLKALILIHSPTACEAQFQQETTVQKRKQYKKPEIQLVQTMGQLTGEQALEFAKQCLYFPLPDSLVYFSQCDGFFSALNRDDANKLRLLTSVVTGLTSTARAQDVATLKSFLIQLVRQAPELLETLAEIPNCCHLEEIFKAYMKSSNDFVLNKRVMTRILGFIGNERLIAILLGLPTINAKSRYLLQELEAKHEFIELCVQHANVNLKLDDDEQAQDVLMRVIQLASTTLGEEEEYWQRFLVKIDVSTSREFRRLVHCLQSLCCMEEYSHPAWAIKLEIKLVNQSSLRQMKCRSIFVSKARERLATSSNEENKPAMQVEEFVQEFEIMNEVPSRLVALYAARPDYVKRSILPGLQQHSSSLCAALQLQFPQLFTDNDGAAAMEEELCGCDEIVLRICNNTPSNIANMPQDSFDALCKNIQTFGVLTLAPSFKLNLFLVRLLLANTQIGSIHVRVQALANLMFQTVPNFVQVFSREILNTRTRFHIQLLGTLRSSIVQTLFQVLVCESSSRSSNALECSMYSIELFARLAQAHPQLCNEAKPCNMVWLRERVGLIQDDWYNAALDLFDAFTSFDDSVYPTLDDFINLELVNRLGSGKSSSVLFIAQSIQVRFQPWQAVELVLKRNVAPNNDFILAIKLVCEQFNLFDQAFALYLNQLLGNSDISCPWLEFGLVLFPRAYFAAATPPPPPPKASQDARMQTLWLKMFT